MWTEEKLAELPVEKDFRQRGMDMTRLETFTDAAFAFALTLLVISFDNVPTNVAELQLALKNIPAFAVSFSLISLFWYAHHTWSRRFGLDDITTVVLTLIFVFVTLVFVFPLRLMASALMAWLTEGWVPFELGDYTPERVAFVFAVYGCGFASMSGLLCLLYRHALKTSTLNLNAEEKFTTRADMQVWIILTGAGVLSTLIALFAPLPVSSGAGWVYALLSIAMPVFGVWKTRQAARLFP
ncbi:MAG: TMEM175 family protein [Lysobacterales bacterium]